MISRIATNMTGSYCLCVSQKRHITFYIVFITACAQNVRLQQERKRVDADANNTFKFNNRVTQSGPLADDASFQFVDV